jgi:hypothetical protein
MTLVVGIRVVDYGRLEGLRSSAVNSRLLSGPRWVPDPTAVTTALCNDCRGSIFRVEMAAFPLFLSRNRSDLVRSMMARRCEGRRSRASLVIYLFAWGRGVKLRPQSENGRGLAWCPEWVRIRSSHQHKELVVLVPTESIQARLIRWFMKIRCGF